MIRRKKKYFLEKFFRNADSPYSLPLPEIATLRQTPTLAMTVAVSF